MTTVIEKEQQLADAIATLERRRVSYHRTLDMSLKVQEGFFDEILNNKRVAIAQAIEEVDELSKM